MKKYKKIIINIILICIFVYAFTPYAFADGGTLDGIVGGADGFLSEGIGQDSPLNDSALQTGSKTLYNVLLVIGVGVALIWGAVLGIQFVTGSVEAKADIKKNLIAYLVGCVIIFGAFGIWQLVIGILGTFAQ